MTRGSRGGDDARDDGSTRRARWMIAGIAFNTVASLTAIALWAVAPRGGAVQHGAPPPAARAPSADNGGGPVAHRTTPAGRAMRTGHEGADAPAAGALALPHGPPNFMRRPSFTSSSETAHALGSKLGLDPNVLADQLGDESGAISKPVADRLERGYDAGSAFAKREALDDAKTQAVRALFTNHVFATLRAEKSGSGHVDAEAAEDIRADTSSGLRAACGEAVAKDAEADLADLR